MASSKNQGDACKCIANIRSRDVIEMTRGSRNIYSRRLALGRFSRFVLSGWFAPQPHFIVVFMYNWLLSLVQLSIFLRASFGTSTQAVDPSSTHGYIFPTLRHDGYLFILQHLQAFPIQYTRTTLKNHQVLTRRSTQNSNNHLLHSNIIQWHQPRTSLSSVQQAVVQQPASPAA